MDNIENVILAKIFNISTNNKDIDIIILEELHQIILSTIFIWEEGSQIEIEKDLMILKDYFKYLRLYIPNIIDIVEILLINEINQVYPELLKNCSTIETLKKAQLNELDIIIIGYTIDELIEYGTTEQELREAYKLLYSYLIHEKNEEEIILIGKYMGFSDKHMININ